MAQIEVCGASDDLIEIAGDIYEEFSALGDGFDDDGDGGLLAFSDGTILKIVYSNEGIWRISPVHHGSATYELTQGTDIDIDYTDKAILIGDIEWVVHGSNYAKARILG